MSDAIHAQTLIQAFESWVPKTLAFENDKIGCQIGTLNKKVRKVMVTLDVLENVVDEAVEQNVDLIVAHHAVIFRPLKNVRSDQGQGRIVAKCIKHDIAVYVAHTNFDIAAGGMNDLLAKELSLQDIAILKPTYTEPLHKIAVFVPMEAAETVRQALGASGAGAIGNYSHCTFNSEGTGTFLPGEGTNPHIGAKGQLEKVNEVKIETIVPDHLLKTAIKKMVAAHPYEEVAYDIFPMENQGETYGLGRIGKLQQPITLKALALEVKRRFGLDGVRMTGNPDAVIEKVAVSGGDGNSLVPFAKYRGADVLITGDIYYHTAHDAILNDLMLIDAGHYIEKVLKKPVKDFFDKVVQENGSSTEVVISGVNTNPFTFI
ncbi:dinuclear metal center YbgI/SA1388 family protein [Scopulibacillus darangshiensis]|uniref:GTP cyclohydrolase 1 type 2 homolog n=1 Tax=Scopulibacillus darangshiensis TaxID=442528 RepID=A0A4R2PBE8_9BACL|nr:Nif3-like dinuclear metal center hexameric protein [Scopulibacillus darangshiensis]TCP32362.1 dinuclear metal center YbgI/SA1388 family protein [Scopulibacillus darangshiensis]